MQAQPLCCALCGSVDDVHVNETWAGTWHSACNHAACRRCLRRWVADSLPGCLKRGQLRVACFGPGCRKVLPHRAVLAFSDSANLVAELLEEKTYEPQVLDERCAECGRSGVTAVNAACGHAACGDCWVEWAGVELQRCRVERRQNLLCCHIGCQAVVDREFWRGPSQWSPAAMACVRYFEECDAKLETLRAAGMLTRQAPPDEAGSICPICCERQLALLCGEAECSEHVACLDCWLTWAGQHLQRYVEQRAPSVPCLFPRCRGVAGERLWPSVCARNTQAAELERKFVGRRRLQNNPFFPAELQIDCPQPGCVGLGYLGYDTVMCFQCEHQWVPEEGAGQAPDTNVEIVMGLPLKKCPKCSEYIEKNGGCDHMTCRCKYEFYWTTLQPYRR